MTPLIVFFAVVYSIVCVVLILLIIMQGGKAEGLFASAQSNVLGGQRGNILTRITKALSGVFIVGAMVISFLISLEQTPTERAEALRAEQTEQQPAQEQQTQPEAFPFGGTETFPTQ